MSVVSVLGVAAVLIRVLPTFWMPLNFDESYNLQVVLNLDHGHGYATDGALLGGQRIPFDYHITTGPSVLLPVAAVVAVLGTHVWVFRLVPALFTLGLCGAWWRLGAAVGGSWAALASVVGLLAVDTRLGWPGIDPFDPGSVIGENAAVFLLLAAVLCLHRPAFAGVLCALSVLAKTILVLGLPGIALGVVLVARRRGIGTVRSGMWWTLVLVGVLTAAQAFRVMLVGWSTALATDRAYLRFIVGDPYDPGPGKRPGTLAHALIQLGMVGQWGGALALCVAAATIVVAWRQGWRVPDELRPAAVALLVAGGLLELWWLGLETEGWPRHSMVASEVWVPLVLAVSVAGLRHLSGREGRSSAGEWRKVVVVALPATLASQFTWTVATAVWHPGPTLSDQQAVAVDVRDLGSSFRFTDDHMSPELSVLQPLSARPLSDQGGLLVRSGLWGAASTSGCDRILYERAGYVVCRVDPTR